MQRGPIDARGVDSGLGIVVPSELVALIAEDLVADLAGQHSRRTLAQGGAIEIGWPSLPFRKRRMTTVFLVDVDNTLLDNDRIQRDIQEHLERTFGPAARRRYWEIQEAMFAELGYRDYLGALQRYRTEHPKRVELLAMTSFLMDYPFADRLYPSALEVLQRLRSLGTTVVLSDGDVVFQPRKIERAGLSGAVDGHVLIYIHKEDALDDIERRYPAAHYVLVDDKLRILTAVKRVWGPGVTTVFPRQGMYADPGTIGSFPPADVTIERIGDLLDCDLPTPG
ncbi:MAG TPA: HAD family hydrolase [Geminicoccaceae bacterium]|nr:HAD family hydrolase [Geminicoccaceae bacterium]